MTSKKRSVVDTTIPVKSIDKDEQIINLVSTLYQHHIFQEFRLPVLVQYPNLCDSYLKKVHSPMDLGTLLSKALQRQLSVDELRDGLQRMIANALLFNKDYSPYIISTTKHLETMALGLFEEYFRVLYHLSANTKTNNTNSSSLDSAILLRRKRRYELVENVSLNQKELETLGSILDQFKYYITSFPALVEAIDQIQQTLSDAEDHCLERINAVRSNQPSSEDIPLHFPLKTLIEPLIDKICSREVNINNNTTVAIDNIPLVTTYFLPKVRNVNKIEGRLPILQELDHLLGIVLVHIEERIFRGFTYSNCWNIPYPQCVWSQVQNDARHRNQWWPGMILVSNSDQYPMSLEIMEKNLERLPKAFIKDLIKFRPKPTNQPTNIATPSNKAELDSSNGEKGESSLDLFVDMNSNKQNTNNGHKLSNPGGVSKTSIDCPEGYLLVEYFGAHDLGWALADSTMPMPESGELPKFPKVCAMDVFKEGEEGRRALERFHRSFGSCAAFPKLTDNNGVELDIDDLTEIPSLSELLEQIRYPPELVQMMQDFEEQKLAKEKQQQQMRESLEEAKKDGITEPTSASKKKDSSRRKSTSQSEEVIDLSEQTSNPTRSTRKRNSTPSKTSTSEKKAVNSSGRKKVVEPNDEEDDNNDPSEHEIDHDHDDSNDEEPEEDNPRNGRHSRPRAMKGRTSISYEIVDNRGNNLTHVASPSKLRPIDFKITLLEKAIIQGKFYVSKCSNPSFITPSSNGSEILPGFYSRKGINYRRNAVFKSRAFTHWLHKTKPLLLTESITAFPMTMSGSINTMVKTASNNTLTRDVEALTTSQQDLIAFGSKKKNQSIRNYQNPIASTYEELQNIPTHEFFQNIHDTLLEQGCTRFYIGKGIFHTRIVDLDHPLFHREDRDMEKRKDKIWKEISTIKYMTAKLRAGEELSEVSEGEEEEEEEKAESDSKKEKKISFEGMFSDDEDIFGLNYGSSDEEVGEGSREKGNAQVEHEKNPVENDHDLKNDFSTPRRKRNSLNLSNLQISENKKLKLSKK